ncbi:MAG: imidazole glycerol phosphate synthase subunit HisH [Candidatus Omnitrophica bacterium]|nr:imidazole glycerol phosphate synthase subunit HisH [Candidatus Omnitrophota bacterium]
MKIAIIDYGMGNIHSVAKAVALFGARPVITNKKNEISSCDKMVLPGVGAFDDAVLELEKQDLISVIKEQVDQKKAFLGICLGLQLLFESSQEAKIKRGLGILSGRVVKFRPESGLKVPHMGWNDLKVVAGNCPLLDGITGNSQVYFCHSYYPDPADKSAIAATTHYGLEFASVLWKDNVYGAQFHPEKSQATGLKMIKNFVERC